MPFYSVIDRKFLIEQIELLGLFNPVLLKQAFDEERPFCIDEEVDVEGRRGMIRHSFSKDGEAVLEVKIDGMIPASIRLNGDSLSIQGLDGLSSSLGGACRPIRSLEDFC